MEPVDPDFPAIGAKGRAAPIIHAIASAWSSCVEMPIQRRLFCVLCAATGHQICGADVQDAHAHAKASGTKTRTQASDAHIEWAQEALGKETKKGSVLEVPHSLQRHLLSGTMDENDRQDFN